MSEKKLLRINQNGDEELTFEEVYTRYRNLIWSQVQHWEGVMDSTEVESAANFGLFKAYKNYNFEKRPTAFGYYAKRVISNEILMLNRHDRKRREKTISLFDTITTDDDGDNLTFADTLMSAQNVADSYEEKVSFSDDLNLAKELISKLPEGHQKIVYGVISGKTQRKASEDAGYTQSYGSRIIRKLYKNFLKEKKKRR
jgi:RNA polymerase sigma factor (sigma-70 family)